VLRQLQWIWQLRWTGGYFLLIGKKPVDSSTASGAS
jgi:hypothetical protein